MIEILSSPLFVRAIVVGVGLAVLLPFVGVFITTRKMSFIGDGVAHASLAGIAIGLLAGVNPLWTALVVAVLFAVLLLVLERRTQISSDAIIGMLFTTGMAIGVILMSVQTGYQPELVSFLFGNILTIQAMDVPIILGMSAAAFVVLLLVRKQLMLNTIDSDEAWLRGISPVLMQLLLYVMTAIAIVLSVKMLGIILASALLVIPTTTAKLVASSLRQLYNLSVVLGVVMIIAGLVIAFIIDLPSGPVIILTGMAMFGMTLGASTLIREGKE